MRPGSWLICAAVITGLVACARWARAEPAAFGQSPRTVVSLENVAGFSYVRLEVGDGPATETTQTGTFTPYVGPISARMRLGVHHFVAPPVSLGALLSYSDNDIYGTHVLLGGRVGVALSLGRLTAVWLRGGLSYARDSIGSDDDQVSFATLSPGGEAFFVLRPYESFGALLGGSFETTVWGQRKAKDSRTTSTGTEVVEIEDDYRRLEVGLSAGIFAEF